MPNSTGASSMHPTVAPVDSGPVQAYAKLEGDSFCYYIRTLQVTLGRKASSSDIIDIPLGATKSVSRQHARLFYNFSTQRFEMMVLGKNGAFVNEQFVEKGITVPLDNRTKIQIGEVSFTFLLPRMDSDEPQDNMPYGSGMQHDHRFSQKINTSMMTPIKNDEQTPTPTSEQFDVGGIYGSKDQKPPYSYASLIAQAINSTNSRKMTLNGIYNYITTNYPYYQMASNGWQNSIRHNLSLNKAFVKVPRADSEPGKGAFWSIDPLCENQFSNGVYKRNRRSVTKILSTPDMRRSSMDTSSLPYDPAAIANGLRNRAQMESQYAELQRRPPSSSGSMGSMMDSNHMNVVTPTPSENDMEYNHIAAMSHSSINSVSMQTHQTPPDSRGSADEMDEDRQSISGPAPIISANEHVPVHIQFQKYAPTTHIHVHPAVAAMLAQAQAHGASEVVPQPGTNGQSHLDRPPAQP